MKFDWRKLYAAKRRKRMRRLRRLSREYETLVRLVGKSEAWAIKFDRKDAGYVRFSFSILARVVKEANEGIDDPATGKLYDPRTWNPRGEFGPTIKLVYAQRKIYKLDYSQSPFFAMLKKEAVA